MINLNLDNYQIFPIKLNIIGTYHGCIERYKERFDLEHDNILTFFTKCASQIYYNFLAGNLNLNGNFCIICDAPTEDDVPIVACRLANIDTNSITIVLKTMWYNDNERYKYRLMTSNGGLKKHFRDSDGLTNLCIYIDPDTLRDADDLELSKYNTLGTFARFYIDTNCNYKNLYDKK